MIRRPPSSPLFPYTPLSGSNPTAPHGKSGDKGNRQQSADDCSNKKTSRAEGVPNHGANRGTESSSNARSEEHTSELQSPCNLVCRLLLETKNNSQRTASKHH